LLPVSNETNRIAASFFEALTRYVNRFPVKLTTVKVAFPARANLRNPSKSIVFM
jgi:hypothetical protein